MSINEFLFIRNSIIVKAIGIYLYSIGNGINISDALISGFIKQSTDIIIIENAYELNCHPFNNPITLIQTTNSNIIHHFLA